MGYPDFMAKASPSKGKSTVMGFLPVTIALDVKRTRTGWQISLRVQFWL
jgi:hypothetical protein